MKRIKLLTVLIAAALCFTMLSATVSAKSTYINGDADGDGEVTIIDATCIQRVLAGLLSDSSGKIALRGDVNQNGLDVIDATAIQRYLAGLDNPYKIGKQMEDTGSDKLPTYGEDELPRVEV